MGRHPRQPSETGYYHVVARGNRRQVVFQAPEDYEPYGRLLATDSVHLAHDCLMPNHVHLLTHAATLSAMSAALWEGDAPCGKGTLHCGTIQGAIRIS